MFIQDHETFYTTYLEALQNAPLELRNKIERVSDNERTEKLAKEIASDNRTFEEILS
ncbi:MAG: hypothetical protein AB7D96_13025 [Arcobacteraceae bacterium]